MSWWIFLEKHLSHWELWVVILRETESLVIITKHSAFAIYVTSGFAWHFASCKFHNHQTELAASIFFIAPKAEQASVTFYEEYSQHDPSMRRILWCENCINNRYNQLFIAWEQSLFILMTARILDFNNCLNFKIYLQY